MKEKMDKKAFQYANLYLKSMRCRDAMYIFPKKIAAMYTNTHVIGIAQCCLANSVPGCVL